MAKKGKTVYVCQECGYESPKWLGQCICGAWGSFVEEKVIESDDTGSGRRTVGAAPGERVRATPLKKVGSADYSRIKTGIAELDRVLGGGLVKGSLVLISGEPGIGKSTLIIQAAANIARDCGRVLYVSGEESGEQIKMRADRVCGDFSDITGACAGALWNRFTNVEQHCFAYQTRDASGRPVRVIPAVPDLDPGYHTNLSLIDVLKLWGEL